MKKIYFGCGCFWGTQAYFKRINGVVNTSVGFSGGITENPTYEQVCEGGTKHYEVCEIEYDENVVSFKELLQHFYSIVNPTNAFGQGMDIGHQYKIAIICMDELQREEAIAYTSLIQDKYDKKVVTSIECFKNYYKASEYHQDYLTKNPNGYCHIKIPE